MLQIRSILTSQRSLRRSKLFPFHSSRLCYSAAAVESERTIREGPRHDWSKDEIKSIYDSPVLDLLFHGAQVHRDAHNFREVQQCTLLSIKTGGCSEDCSYCPQSSRYNTGVKAQKLMTKETVMQAAQKAKEAGSTRFCMGAAWRDTIGRKTNFNNILEYVKEIREMGMEVCCTLGMLEKQQALELKKAGLTAYNHNLDTSREYYPNIITTRSYDERLETLKHVREAGINVCSGGIIGLGEAEEDRVGLLHTLATLPTHPESVPFNDSSVCGSSKNQFDENMYDVPSQDAGKSQSHAYNGGPECSTRRHGSINIGAYPTDIATDT
ncbi:biotin synthase, mitochondrial-like [Mangifera indica]|uniref:biotin synthase, mitochondrial-like n=1 Tax=Mangifera indica TaxID=29780 RepID=UPI001CFC3654|nr:biotin synthase, mitochondrial-like [Mangifera indica]